MNAVASSINKCEDLGLWKNICNNLKDIIKNGEELYAYIDNKSIVVSWAKGLRYRPNRIQCRESRGIVGYINVSLVFSSEQFRGKGLRDPGHGR